MARATGMLQEGLRGAVGDLIFRKYNGKTVVSMRPVYKNETKTEARRKARENFSNAAMHASIAMEDCKLKQYYKQKARQLKLPNAYTAALTDYLRRAKVAAVKAPGFDGKKGDSIRIDVSKSVFNLNKIKAILYNSTGEVLEAQTFSKPDYRTIFIFKFSDDFPDYGSFKIITEDEPGNKTYLIRLEEWL